jgi:hypothetical protein
LTRVNGERYRNVINRFKTNAGTQSPGLSKSRLSTTVKVRTKRFEPKRLLDNIPEKNNTSTVRYFFRCCFMVFVLDALASL